MLDLKELERKVDEMIANDTPAEMMIWLKAKIREEESRIKWNCNSHPISGWHETGCPHRGWTKEQLQTALEIAKTICFLQKEKAK